MKSAHAALAFLGVLFALLAPTAANAAAPVAVATGLQGPTIVRIDDAVNFVDVTRSGGTVIDSSVNRVAKTGGAITTLADGLVQFDSGSNRPVGELYSDGARLVAMDGGYVTAPVFSISKAGGAPTRIATLSGGYALGANAGLVYIGSDFDYIGALNPDSSITPLVSGYWTRSSVLDSGLALYFVDYLSTVNRLDLSTDTVTTLAAGRTIEPGDLVINSTTAFWDERGAVYSVPKTGGTLAAIATVQPTQVLGADDRWLYVSESGELRAYNLADTTQSQTLATSMVAGFDMDATNVYWSDPGQGAGYGSVYTLPKPSSAQCTGAEFLGVRGSGESFDVANGMGATVGAVFTATQKSLPGLTGFGIPYDAIPVVPVADFLAAVGISVELGRQVLVFKIRSDHANCPATRILLAGYSQGSMVVVNALHSLSTDELSSIAGVVLVGDPTFTPKAKIDAGPYDRHAYGILVTEAGYAPTTVPVDLLDRTLDYCGDSDFICGDTFASDYLCTLGDPADCGHYTYGSQPKGRPTTTQIATWLAKQAAHPR